MFEKPKATITFWTITGAVTLGILIAHATEILITYAWTSYKLQWLEIKLKKMDEERQRKERQQLESNRRLP